MYWRALQRLPEDYDLMDYAGVAEADDAKIGITLSDDAVSSVSDIVSGLSQFSQ
jgi:hypothetical protein